MQMCLGNHLLPFDFFFGACLTMDMYDNINYIHVVSSLPRYLNGPQCTLRFIFCVYLPCLVRSTVKMVKWYLNSYLFMHLLERRSIYTEYKSVINTCLQDIFPPPILWMFWNLFVNRLICFSNVVYEMVITYSYFKNKYVREWITTIFKNLQKILLTDYLLKKFSMFEGSFV